MPKTNYLFLLIAALFGAACSTPGGSPAQVLILRHAEKPKTGNELSERGRERAAALVGFFASDPSVNQYGKPSAIYAAGPTSLGKSIRPRQTVQPLADSLGLPVIDKYTKNDIPALIEEIMSSAELQGRSVVICWVHDSIADLAKAFGVDSPPEWNDATLDRVWKLEYQDGKVIRLTDLPQKVLAGDSQE